MDELIEYLNSLKPELREDLCIRAGTKLGYIRKAASVGQRLGVNLCINFERETHGAIKCESLRPDVDWAYIRGTAA